MGWESLRAQTGWLVLHWPAFIWLRMGRLGEAVLTLVVASMCSSAWELRKPLEPKACCRPSRGLFSFDPLKQAIVAVPLVCPLSIP